jgi:hypothetical protein
MQTNPLPALLTDLVSACDRHEKDARVFVNLFCDIRNAALAGYSVDSFDMGANPFRYVASDHLSVTEGARPRNYIRCGSDMALMTLDHNAAPDQTGWILCTYDRQGNEVGRVPVIVRNA